MEHDTPSHDYTSTYQISLIYRKRRKSYDSETITLQKYQLCDLEVKGQRQNVVMLVHDTPSHDYTLTYQISLTYLKRQKSYMYGPTDSKFANPFRMNKELTPFLSIFLYNFTYLFFIWTVTQQFLNFIFLRNIWTIQLQKI
jgi:hypothetical protein